MPVYGNIMKREKPGHEEKEAAEVKAPEGLGIWDLTLVAPGGKNILSAVQHLSYPFPTHLPRTGHWVVMKQEERVKAKTTGTCRRGDGETVLQPTCGSLMRESKP